MSSTRRDVLRGIGATGIGTLLGSALPASASADAGEVTVLGDFESGLDGWRTNGGATLERVGRASRPTAVRSGERALQVTANGDVVPMIANERRVADSDLVEYPYLFAGVTPGRVADAGSSVTFRFRLRYSREGRSGGGSSDHERRTGGDGRAGDGRSGGDGRAGRKPDSRDRGAPVVESEEITVPPHVSSVLTWDTSAVDEAKRASAKRLEIVWYPEGRPPETSPRGRDSGPGFEESVVFDDVHLSDDRERTEVVRMAGQWESLKRSRGPYRRTNVIDRDEHGETGEFVFEDGSTVPYAYETHPGEETRQVIGETVYRFGGEWA